MDYACIKNGVVDNVIVASPAFVKKLQGKYVRIDRLSVQPGLGWLYDDKDFTSPLSQPTPQVGKQQGIFSRIMAGYFK